MHLMLMMYHDMTGIGAYCFGAPDIQNLTYSEYYGSNVLKGGVFAQCGGWLGTHELWGGNVSDSDYNRNAGHLEEQAAFHKMICAMGNFCDLQMYTTKVIELGQFAGSMVNVLRSPSLGGVMSASLAVILFTRRQLHQIGLVMSEQ